MPPLATSAGARPGCAPGHLKKWAAAGRYGSLEKGAHGSPALFPFLSPTVMPVHVLPALTLSQLVHVGKQAEAFLLVCLFSCPCTWVPCLLSLKRVCLLSERGVFWVLVG